MRRRPWAREPVSASLVSSMAIPVLTTVLSGIPLFMVGSLSVAIRQEMGFSEVALGGLVTSFGIVTLLTSIPLGGLVERFGYAESLCAAALLSGAAMIMMGAMATSWLQMAIAMSVGGLGASLVNPAANLALARSIKEQRRGLAVGIKQASVPVTVLLASLAIPLTSEAGSWRWAFLGFGLLAVAVAVASKIWLPEHQGLNQTNARIGRSRSPLILITTAVFFGMFGVQGLATFLVEAAIAHGMVPSSAGLVLAVGSTIAIASRVALGWIADSSSETWALKAVTALMMVGASGCIALAFGTSTSVLVVAALAGLGGGLGWNGLIHLAIVRHHVREPAFATGIMLTGAFGGASIGPLVFGATVVASGYPAAWLTAGASMLVAAALVTVARRR